MQPLKHYFAIPYVALIVISFFYSLYAIITDARLAWAGALLALAPMTWLFSYIGIAKTARVKTSPPLFIGIAAIGSIMAFIDYQVLAFNLAFLLGVVATALYYYWYTPFDRSQSHLAIDSPLPTFEVQDIEGNNVTDANTKGRNAVWMFIRGNWCPLCVAQVAEISKAYNELEKMDTDIFLISSQSQEHSKSLANRFKAPIRFLVDKGNAMAKAFGIEHISGVPFGMPGYDLDTAMPTVVITDKEGKVIFLDQTDDYRIRPEPETFIQVLKQKTTA